MALESEDPTSRLCQGQSFPSVKEGTPFTTPGYQGIHECDMWHIFCYLRGQGTITFCSCTSKQLPCFLQIILKTVFWKSLGPDFKGPLSAG